MNFLLRKLIRDVTRFYDQFYMGDPYVKYLHLMYLEEMFNREIFEKTENLAAERVAFLTRVQEEVSKVIY